MSRIVGLGLIATMLLTGLPVWRYTGSFEGIRYHPVGRQPAVFDQVAI